ncbi:hypothetical protein BB558_001141 [Smittium angustum]|uniref:AAA+ ATPase domain-containing protein n=2 Tax=Smittium angustum TaxID=133377 RepID=A0A2U1JCM1_SMIAN|nr:hypothetical protein BB558_001141 [Smittium angustum]
MPPKQVHQKLTVGKRKDEKDEYFNRVYLSISEMRNRTLCAGDLVIAKKSITDSSKPNTNTFATYCGVAWPSFTCTPKEIQISSLGRINLKAEIGDHIFLEKQIKEIDSAKQIIVSCPTAEKQPFFTIDSETVITLDENNHKTLNSTKTEEKVDKTSGYKKVGGLKKQIQIIKETVELPLLSPEIFTKYGLVPPRGVLLYGPPGTGKTLIAKAVGEETNASVVTINGSEVASKYYGETESNLADLFEKARKSQPAIIFIDEIDALCPKRDSTTSNTENRVVTSLLTLMDITNNNNDRIVIIGATNRPNSLDEALRRPGRFDREIEISVPSNEERLEIFKVIMKDVPNILSEEELTTISDSCHGFVGADIAALCREAGLNAIKRLYSLETSSKESLEPKIEENSKPNTNQTNKVESDKRTSKGSTKSLLEQNDDNLENSFLKMSLEINLNEKNSGTSDKNINNKEERYGNDRLDQLYLTFNDFVSAAPSVKPSSMREVALEVPKVYWDEIGGQDEVKERLKEAVEWPLKFPELFTRMGIKPPKGILLYGPPGCSKTLVAKALATESKLNFMAVKGPELFSKYVGESEKAVKRLFKRARLSSPSIIFFDEIDALATSRSGSSDSSSVSERVLSQLLSEMDGIEPLVQVTIVAATNRPDIIDHALLRPGRFDRLIYVPPPDYKTRCSIFAIQLKKMVTSPDVSPEALSEMSDGFSGAEVVSLCQEAAMAAMEENIGAEQVEMKHFKSVRLNFKLQITKEMIEFYEEFRLKNL